MKLPIEAIKCAFFLEASCGVRRNSSSTIVRIVRKMQIDAPLP